MRVNIRRSGNRSGSPGVAVAACEVERPGENVSILSGVVSRGFAPVASHLVKDNRQALGRRHFYHFRKRVES